MNGGGQPIMSSVTRENVDYKALRASVLYKADKNAKLRKSHDNPVVKELYDTFLGKPGSHKAHEILHTEYEARERYKK